MSSLCFNYKLIQFKIKVADSFISNAINFIDYPLVVLTFHKNDRSDISVNRGFPKVDHSGIDARIVLEQINSAIK